MIDSIKKLGSKIIPNRLKYRINNSRKISRIIDRMDAKKFASTSKRLDLCSAQIALVLHLSELSGKFPLRGKVCVELGSGLVLSHAIVLYLLGAKKVIATDIERKAHPSSLFHSINGSTISIIRDILSPFEEHNAIRSRLNKLISIKTFNFDVLEELGIEYVAPIDLAVRPLNTKIDFVFSFSVLEHVPINDILPLLENLEKDLSEEGKMIHVVHLEDHEDIVNNPFNFLSESMEKFTRSIQCSRGNRIRRSQWNNILSHVKGMEFRFIYQWARKDKKLPTLIDPSIYYEDEEDLAISHLGIIGIKKKIC
jgi:hypothetical protein